MRKLYLQTVEERNQEMIKMLQEYEQKQLQDLAKQKEEEAKVQFYNTAKSLHHLVSTKIIPGVYKPPNRMTSEESIYGITMEDHLRTVTRTEYYKLGDKFIEEIATEKRKKKELVFYPQPVKVPNIHHKDKSRIRNSRYGPFQVCYFYHFSLLLTFMYFRRLNNN